MNYDYQTETPSNSLMLTFKFNVDIETVFIGLFPKYIICNYRKCSWVCSKGKLSRIYKTI